MPADFVQAAALTVGASFVVWNIYHRYEPAGFLSAGFLLFAIPGFIAHQVQPLFSSLTRAYLTIFTIYWGVILLFTTAYRLSPFHPLAKYPGPTACKVSKIWMSVIAAKGYTHRYVCDLHTQYGDVVRIGPNELSFRHEDLINPILANKELRKGPYYDIRTQDGVSPLDGLKDYAEHAARRRLWNRGTSVASAKTYTDHLRHVIDEFMQALAQRQDQTIDISKWMSFAALDFMGHMTESFDMIKIGRDHNGLIHAVDEICYQCHVVSQTPWIFAFLKYIPGAASGIKTARRAGQEVADKRMKRGSNSRDLYHYLLDEDGFEKIKPSKDVALVEGILSIIAGADTTATAIVNAVYFLLKNPEVKKRLQAEIDDALSAQDSPDYTKFVELPFLNACVNETLRLLPPGLTGFQRQVDPKSGGKMLGEYFVPAGTNVSAHLYTIQRDPRYFQPLPLTFWPDRWLEQDVYTLPSGEKIGKDQVVLSRNAFYPFSTGQQSCAGKTVAHLELRSILIALLHRFEILPAKGYRVDSYEENLMDVYVTLRGPLQVQLQSRLE
ncbi:unnamed protein product [Somion occarium]|uniref:Cytochrome P450 n=1 Tax=Somion occarium TaxID=3059160 RepID=A0ABP1DK40_9APHY